MQIRPIKSLMADPNQMITGIDGSQFPYADVTFNSSDYSFTYVPADGSPPVDETDNITRADKLTFPGFDPTVDNNRLSYAVHKQTVNAAIASGQISSPLQNLDTSTTDLFAQGIKNEVNVGQGSVTSKLLTYAVTGVVLYAVLQAILNPRR